MKYINISLIVSILLLFASCTKDENLIVDAFNDSPIPEELFYSEFEGIVVDINDQVVTDAVVYIGDEETKTDQLGLFKIVGFFNAQGTKIKVEKMGYWSTHGFVLPLLDTRSQLQVQLRNRENDADFNSTEQHIIKGDGYTVDLSANSFVNDNGTPYSGKVFPSVNYINVDSEEGEDYFLGSFISSENNAFIASYGIVEVELEGNNQENLNINASAVLSFEIPASLVSNAPDEIALWSLNEETSLWIKEGIAKKEGNQYIGAAEHFSTWMIGEEFDLVKFSGNVIRNGVAYPNAVITVADGFSNRTFRAGTDGSFSFGTFTNSTLDITVEDACREIVFESTIAVGATDMSSDFEVPVSINTITVEGQVSCGDMAVTDGVIVVFGNGNTVPFSLNTSGGSYSFQVEQCQSSVLRIYGQDRENNTVSETVTVTGSGVVNLDVCEEEIDSELVFTAFKDKMNPNDPDEIDFIYRFENALIITGEEMIDGEVHQFYELSATDANYDSGERPVFAYRWTEGPDGQINYGSSGIQPVDVTNLPYWNIISLFVIDNTVEVTDGKYVYESSAGMTTHYSDGTRDIIKLGKLQFNVKVQQ